MNRSQRRGVLALSVTLLASAACTKTAEVELDWHTDPAVARDESMESGKPILANFTGSDWCHWCVKLHEEVFATQEFADWAAAHVVLLKVDLPRHTPQPADLRAQNQSLAQRYGVSGFPTILFLNASGETLGKIGYVRGGARRWIESAEQFTGPDD